MDRVQEHSHHKIGLTISDAVLIQLKSTRLYFAFSEKIIKNEIFRPKHLNLTKLIKTYCLKPNVLYFQPVQNFILKITRKLQKKGFK